MNNLMHINFDYFKSFDGMTVEFEARKLRDDKYGVSATVRLNKRLFLEYDCIAHYSYFDELIYKSGEVRVDVTMKSLNDWLPFIANFIEGWEVICPNMLSSSV